MIGMSFNSFLMLLVTGGIVAFLVHYVARYRIVSGAEGFFGMRSTNAEPCGRSRRHLSARTS